ncbi:MBL fold metallo-hydrolase [Bacillus sp. DTU_2020_1000418_1_SI_GHA_SEK_038]|uniref:MBL fold metallo-hydrolase n=1 Tax=Bacillus sp. DTU_2020_1000418_1_SI_GHA_SEK_038 TaxID=3077585 RepID=UPI0028E6DEF9|nr:MBL fold metallo-hydrolase [Bacillus sp. DTU_2020_1000418_1_SI_GHA_SEK_038]WNS75774.1 MBL fold metallo-hydrolase [Bacillus sp. DTU_2020_1000418_1_SI_GHA_SEK_038]
MKITKMHSVYQLAFMPRLFPVNCYLVEEETSLTLIDAAMPYSAKSIIQAAKTIGKPIKNIIITHAHADHVGALDILKENLPEAQVSISSRDSHLLRGDTTILSSEKNTPIRGGVPKNIKTHPDILLNEGEHIGSLEVIHSPGHTPGSISLMDKRNRSLIVGDAFQTRGGIAVSGTVKPLFPFPALATWDKESALKSARKLIACQPSLLAAGHGKMIDHPMELMKWAIEQVE